MKAHPFFGDSVVAGLIVLVDLLLNMTREFTDEAGQTHPWYVTVPLILLAVAPLVFRRRYPVAVAYAVLAASIPHALLELGLASAFTTCISLYTLVAYVGRRQALLYVVANAVVTGIQTPLQVDDRANVVAMLIVVALMLALCWVLGEFVGARRAYHEEVERRLSLLEVERDHQARMAVNAERARIARELHDVVAHAVSVMVVQADGAAYAVHTKPELAERAVKTISDTGREALTELRRLLGLLRDEDAAGELTPQPGAQSLAELAERVREVGLPVRLEIVGGVDDLPAGIGLGIYRIVQEALTNSLKHAGQGTHARVRVVRTADHVELDVSDDGRHAIRTLLGVAGGNGLIGMRERALVFGGTLEAGPGPGGGWQVRARLPLLTE
ncbi:two-component sensor histidine kinase [Actinophytocola xinjiangensis]|uniref:histidine kinase n=1 Tax=Actinophytocola xinjiangensis TaxID=485602 RepID=A0A7Z1AT98_9PSEU|nr:histidine kinase [Actinophytocola xinjiangensis]OLF04565.1 two-component sensor histidine kinase [Actinophytocola xinjiangensis]